MADWAEKRKLMNASLKGIVVPELRSRGFKGSYPHFRRIVDDHVRVIGFQFSQWGPQFYIELGVCGLDGTTIGTNHYPPEKIKHYQVYARRRIGALPFDCEDANTDAIAGFVLAVLKDCENDWNWSVSEYRNLLKKLEGPV
ncbi:DUF4304 domain-containing protein [Pirellulaceae bacterium SH501]